MIRRKFRRRESDQLKSKGINTTKARPKEENLVLQVF